MLRASIPGGPGHPMAPIRLKLTIELARAFGLGHLRGVSIEHRKCLIPADAPGRREKARQTASIGR
jgi:hypothetical protein